MLTIPQDMPIEPNGKKKSFNVNLSISYSIPRRYARIQADNEEQALELALVQLKKDTWGVKNVEVIAVEEV